MKLKIKITSLLFLTVCACTSQREQNSESGKINISGSTYELVKTKFKCEHRGKIEAKNKGMIDMYFVGNSL